MTPTPTMEQFKHILENGARFVIEGCTLEYSSGEVFKVKISKDEQFLTDFDTALAILLAYIGKLERRQ